MSGAARVPGTPVALSTSSVYPERTPEAFEIAARLGYDGIEVMVYTDPVSQTADALNGLSAYHQLPIVAVHASLLPTGEVLISDGQWLGNDARVWNPATNTFTSVTNNTTNLFCSAHCHLADGRVLFAGGHLGPHTGVTDTNLFDPTTHAWALVAAMHTARWHPTATLSSIAIA